MFGLYTVAEKSAWNSQHPPVVATPSLPQAEWQAADGKRPPYFPIDNEIPGLRPQMDKQTFEVISPPQMKLLTAAQRAEMLRLPILTKRLTP